MNRTQYDKEVKLWKGRDVPPLYNPKISTVQVLLKSCANFGPKVAQISADSGIELTYDEIRIKTIRAAQNLQKRGYNSKEVFGFVAKNSHHLAPIVFASLAIGSPVNALDPSFGQTELLNMFNTTKPALIFCDVECYDLVKLCLDGLGNCAKVFTFGGSKDGSEQVENLFEETHNESDFVPVEVDGENEIAAIVCSSGTTGLQKGVCLSHASLLRDDIDSNLFNSNDVLLAFSTLYWLTGWKALLMGTINGATRVITTETYSAEMHLDIIEKYRVTFGINTPSHLASVVKSEHLNRADLSSLKILAVGGSKCSFNVQKKLTDRLPNGKVCHAYGLTETSGIVAFNLGTTDSVGQLINSISAKIIDKDGNRCGIGESGEVCFKTIYRFRGYYGNQKAIDGALDEEGFFLAGDIGYFDEDGNLYIVDRKKEMFKYCNFQISPSEIECFLVDSPDIKAVCVIGVPDDVAIDLPAAFIVRNDGSHITEEDVFNLVADHFSDCHKLRGGVYFVDSLPMTPSGKILRRKIKALYLEITKKEI